MATNDSQTTPTAKTSEPAATPALAAAQVPVADAAPVDIRKKKKRKYSRGARSVQEFERGAAKASREIGKAVAKGLSVYVARRDKSSRKKRDGALRDMVENVAKGVSDGVRRGADAPYQFAKAVNTKRFSKQVRSAVRIMLPISLF